jgi:hypothetical protein
MVKVGGVRQQCDGCLGTRIVRRVPAASPPPPDTHRRLRSPGAVCACGLPLGKHRYGSEACPNPHWKPGNGQSQWQDRFFRTA